MVVGWPLGFMRWLVCYREGGVGDMVVEAIRSTCCEFV